MKKHLISALLLALVSSVAFSQTMDLVDVKAFGGSGQDIITATANDRDGNLYIAGTSTSALTIQGTTVNLSGTEPFLAKFNSSGTLVWFKSIATPGFFPPVNAMVIDAQNNIVVCGQSAYVAKYSNTGTLLWIKRPGVDSFFTPTAVAITVDASDNIIFTGEMEGSLNFGGTTISSLHRDYPNIYVTKYSSAGATVFARVFRPDNYFNYSRGKALTTDANGNVYLGGEFENEINIGSVKLTTHNISSDTPFVTRLSPTTGEPQWATIVIDDDDGEELNGLTYYNQALYAVGSFYIQKLSSSNGTVSGGMQGYHLSGANLTGIAVDPTGLINVFGSYYNLGELNGVVFPQNIFGQFAEIHPLILQFRDISSIDWFAAFNLNGSVSAYKDPIGYMTSSGLNKTYMVLNYAGSLTWEQGTFTSSGNSADFGIVQAGAFPIKAHFTVDAVPCDKQALPFTDSSYVNIGSSKLVSREWNFGDNSPLSSEANPKHLYPSPGDYTVTLTIQDDLGNQSRFVKKIWVAPSAIPLVTEDIYTMGQLELRLKPVNNLDGYAQWYTSPESLQPVFQGNSFDLTVPKDTVFYARNKSFDGCLTEQVNTVRVTIGPELSSSFSKILRLRGLEVRVARDASDHIYIATQLDPNQNPAQSEVVRKGVYTILVTKITSDGTVVWSNQLYSSSNEWLGDLKLRPDGKLVVAGSFVNNITMDAITVTTDADQEIFIALINSQTGAVEKIKRFGDWLGGTNQYPKLEVGNDNTVYFTASGNYRVNASVEFPLNCCLNQSYVAKLTANLESYLWGSFVYGSSSDWFATSWEFIVKAGDRVITGVGFDDTPTLGYALQSSGAYSVGPFNRTDAGDLSSLTVDPNGNLLVLLKAKSPWSNTRFGSVVVDKEGHYLISMTSNGTVRWGKKIANMNYFNTQFTISRVDTDGNIYVEGQGFNLPFEQGRPQADKNFVAKYSNEGELLWMGYMNMPEYAGTKYVQLNSGKWVAVSLIDERAFDPGADFYLRNLYLTEVSESDFAVTSIKHSANACVGELISFQANVFDRSGITATEWLWTFGDGFSSAEENPQHAYSGEGAYLVSVKVKDSKGNETSTSSELTVAIAPDASIRFDDGALNVIAITGYQYQWYENGFEIPGATLPAYSDINTDNLYQVRITTASCSVMSSELLITGVENEGLSGIKIYPNPASTVVNIEGAEHREKIVTIFDGIGILYTQSVLNAGESSIDISNLPAGFYFIKISTGNSSITRKLIKRDIR